MEASLSLVAWRDFREVVRSDSLEVRRSDEPRHPAGRPRTTAGLGTVREALRLQKLPDAPPSA